MAALLRRKKPEALTLSHDIAPYFHDDNQPVKLQYAPEMENASVTHNATGFSFQIEGKVFMIDNGGSFVTGNKFIKLTDLNAFHFIIMDPIGVVEEKHLPLRRKAIQHFKLHSLGDGESVPVYIFLDNALSSDLKTLVINNDNNNGIVPHKVITEFNIPSSKLDDINGLEHLEWFILDNRFNLRNVFKHGTRTLQSTLLVAVHYRFEATHQGQMRFDEISETLVQHGFTFHTFSDITYGEPVMIEGLKPLSSSKMVSAQLLFIPDAKRLAVLSFEQREKLAFILHAAYGLYDTAAQVLQVSSIERANLYVRDIVCSDKTESLHIHESKKHSLPQKLIVSLTSYHKRFPTLPLTLECLLKQSIKADRIILWLADSERSLVTDNILAFQAQGVEIKYCEDIKSYKKIVPTLIEDPNAFIVTADDDLAYRSDWLEKLIVAWDGNYKTVVSHRAHKIILNKDGMPIPYKKWNWEYKVSTELSRLIFPTTGSGTLYPPHCFHHDVIDKDIFEKLSPSTDDIWLFWMCRLAGVRFKVVGAEFEIREWQGTSENALWRNNLLQGNNDVNIKKMISHYGFINNYENSSFNEIPISNDLFSFPHADKMVRMYLPNKYDHIQNLVKRSHCFYEPEMLADIAARTKPGSTIIDIGANIGNHSVYFGLFCGAGKVFSFEPQSEVYDTLHKNISLNFLNDKIITFKMGLGSYEATAKLGQVDNKNIGMTKLEINESGEIKISTLDSIVKHEPQNSISIIKIDVEGMEMEVLRGAIKTLERHNPLIYAEAASTPEFDEICQFLKKFSYVATKRFNATATYLFEKRV